MAPFTNWDDIPLVVDIETTARVLNTSSRSIRRAMAKGQMQPQPMPRVTGGKWQWSKPVLQHYIEGGYRQMPVRGRRKGAA